MSGPETHAAAADRVLISVNPKAGRTSVERQVLRLAELLRARGLHSHVETSLDGVERLAAAWHEDRSLRALVAVGGDGTVAELVNRTGPGVPLAVLPTGTANVLAKHLRLSPKPEVVADVVEHGDPRVLDAGRVGGRVFLLMVGCGFDAEVVRQVHQQRQGEGGGHIGYWSYAKPIVRAIRSYQYPVLRVYWEGPSTEGGPSATEQETARWAFVCNVPRYGWGLPLAPQADPADGQLDLCTYTKGSFWTGVGFAAAAQWGMHTRLTGCKLRRVRRVRIESDAPVCYQLDGDEGGTLPLEIDVAARRWTLLLPRAGGLGIR